LATNFIFISFPHTHNTDDKHLCTLCVAEVRSVITNHMTEGMMNYHCISSHLSMVWKLNCTICICRVCV